MLVKLKESFTKLCTLSSEYSLKTVLILKEGHLGILAVNIGQNGILNLSLLNIDVCIREHLVKCVFVRLVRLTGLLFSLEITDFEDGRKELSVVHATLDIESIIDWTEHAINLIQTLSEPADELFGRVGEIHQFDEVEEALERDHLILLTSVKRLAN